MLRAIDVLRRNSVEFNVLTAVQSAHRRRGTEVYRYLVDSGFLYHQYIPIVEFDPAGRPLARSIRGEDWGEFLCEVFDQWSGPDHERVSIRLFDAILGRLVDGRAAICTMGEDCRQYFLVEHNGDVYPCDFFVEPGLRLGNVMETGWAELQASSAWREFGLVKAKYPAACRACAFLELCAADCPRNRWQGSRGPEHPSWLCAGWKMFFAHSLPRFQRLARRIRRQRAQALRGPQELADSQAT